MTRTSVILFAFAAACRPAPGASTAAPAEPAPDPSPSIAATAAPKAEPLEVCASGDDEVCLAILDAPPPAVEELPDRRFATALSVEERATYEAACRAGDRAACAFLGHQTREGLGVVADKDAANRWFRRACALRYWASCNELTRTGDVLGEKISRRWHEAGCDRGDAASCYWAADCYLTKPPLDEARATALLVRACEGKYGPACYDLSKREPDPTRAAELLRQGCEGESPPDACETLRSAKKRP